MKKLLKWILIIGGGLFLIVILCLILIPFFVDMNKYKAPIENKISASIGREFSIKGDLELSLFPWAGISFTDLYLGNPEGFKEKEFVHIKEFEARVKLLPLISKNIQIKPCVLDGAELTFITQKSGRTNLDGLIPSDASPKEDKPETKANSEKNDLPFNSIDVGELSITNSTVLIVDKRQNSRKEITDITLRLKNISLNKPIELNFSAIVDNLPMSAKGKFGPLGTPIGKNDIPVDFSLTAIDEIKTTLKGTLSQIQENPRVDLTIETKPFSLKKVLATLGQKDVLNPSDTNVLEKISFQTKINGNAKAVSLSDGKVVLDDSKIEFKGTVKEFNKPNIAFTAHLNQIDVDRYLPENSPADTPSEKSSPTKPSASSKKPDYTPLRSLVLDVKLKADAIKASNIKIKNLAVNITGNKGIFKLNPMSFDMYNGTVKANSQSNFKTNTPTTTFTLTASDINSNPLIMDFKGKDIIEGTLKADMDISMAGIDPDQIKRSLNGTGELIFKNGAIKGVDLTSMSKNVKTAFGMTTEEESDARTDFAEFLCPFDIVNGVVNTSGTKLASPLIRIIATGKANLKNEKLDFRIEPTFVATTTGQGDTSERSGYKVPVLVTGTFSSPKFAPDVGSIVQDTLKEKLKNATGIENLFKKKSSEDDSQSPEKSVEDAAKGLLKNLPFGR